MPQPISFIRNQGATVDRMVEVQPAGNALVQGLGMVSQDLNQFSEGVMMRERENAYNDYSVKLSENLDRIEQENIADPDKFQQAADGFYKSFGGGIKDLHIKDALDKQFSSWRMTAGRRVKGNFEQNLNQNAQYGALQGLDAIERDMASTLPMMFGSDPVARIEAAGRYQNNMERLQRIVTQKKSDGSFLFTPEFAVNKERQLVDNTLGQALANYIKTDPNPVATLSAMKDGTMPDMSGVFGVASPLDLLSPQGRDRALALAESAISERNKGIIDGWKELKAGLELQMAVDPLSVDIAKATDKFFTDFEAQMTPETQSQVRQGILGLSEKYVKDTEDYRNAQQYLSGEATFDGSNASKKAIEKAYTVMKKRGAGLVDAAKWLQGTNYNDVPQEFAAEMEATVQAALVNGDRAKLEQAAMAYDLIDKMGAAAYAGLQSKMPPQVEGVLMAARDLFKIEGVGPEQFKVLSEMTKTDKMTMDMRKEQLKAFEAERSYFKRAADVMDSWFPFDRPDEASTVNVQMAADFKTIYQNKFMATGNSDLAMKLTKQTLANGKIYGKSQFNRDGMMRMPPEAYYARENDPDTSWMRDDLMAAMQSNPGVFVNFDPDKVQLLSDPNADFSSSEPEYQIGYSDDTTTAFDLTGQVWKPDVAARDEFLALQKTGKLDQKYYTREIYNPNTKKTYTQSTQFPDYGMWIRDWYAKGKDKVSKTDEATPAHVFEKGIIQQESGGRQFDNNGRPLTSNKGAVGIAQVMPGTAPEAADLAGIPFDPVLYRNDASYNKKLGQAYFEKQYDNFGDMQLAIMAYNAGPGAVNKHISRVGDPRKGQVEMAKFIQSFPAAETRNYVKKVTQRVADAN